MVAIFPGLNELRKGTKIKHHHNITSPRGQHIGVFPGFTSVYFDQVPLFVAVIPYTPCRIIWGRDNV